MKKHLTYQDDMSDQFWNIETSGISFTVTYGEGGAVGQSQTKTFDSKEQCLKEADKLVRQKVREGYYELNEAKRINRVISFEDLPEEIWKALKKPIICNTSQGKFVLGPSESCGEIDIETQYSDEFKSYKREGNKGTFYTKAISLTTKASDYYPDGILVWLPEFKVLGSWDSNHLNLLITPDVTIHQVLTDPEYYLTIQWGGRGDEVWKHYKLEDYFDFVPYEFEKQIFAVFEERPDEWNAAIKKWKPILNKYKSLRQRFSHKLHGYNVDLHNEVVHGKYEDVSKKLEDINSFFFDQLLLTSLKEFTEFKELESFLEREQFSKSFISVCEQNDLDNLLPLILRLHELKDKKKIDTLICHLYNCFNSFVKTKKLKEGKTLLKTYLSIIPLIGHANILVHGKDTDVMFNLQEVIAGDAIALSIYTQDDEVFKMAEQFIPDSITHGRLAFHLACLYALKKNKERFLHYTRFAINLGKTKQEFMEESDFSAYKTDEEFLSILN